MSNLFYRCSSLFKKSINKPIIIKENHRTNELYKYFFKGKQKEEKLEKNLKKSEKNNIMECENNPFASYNELRNNKSIRDFYDNFENCNSESINFVIILKIVIQNLLILEPTQTMILFCLD